MGQVAKILVPPRRPGTVLRKKAATEPPPVVKKKKPKRDVPKMPPQPPPTVRKRRTKQQHALLARLRKYPVVYAASAQCGVDRSTYYRWRRADATFAAEADEALHEGTLFMNDMVESILLKKAKEENMTAVIFWLKNNSSNYGDRSEHIHRHLHRFEKSSEDGLTAERKQQIYTALKAWDNDDTDEDEETEEDE